MGLLINKGYKMNEYRVSWLIMGLMLFRSIDEEKHRQ